MAMPKIVEQPVDKPRNARMKCGPKGFCWLLDRFFTEANRAGVNPVVVTNMETFKHRTIAVAYRRTEKHQGTCFNFCPMCGTDLGFLSKSKPRK